MLTERYQQLSPWLCFPLDRSSRAYLEAHLELLDGESDQFLEMFIAEHKETRAEDERRRLLLMKHILRDARTRGGTVQAVREAYVNVLGGLILDPPLWLHKIEQRWLDSSEAHWTDRRLTVCKLQLREAIEQAQSDQKTAPEITAELQYQLGNFFANEASRRSLEMAVDFYTPTLQVYTAERYPLHCARILLALGDVHRRMEDEQRANLSMKSLSYYSRAMEIYSSYDLF